MNPMTQLLAQQRITDMHRAAARGQVSRQAKAARTERVSKARHGLRRAQPVCAT